MSGRDRGRMIEFGDFWCNLPGTEWRLKLSPIPMLAGNGSELRPFSTARSMHHTACKRIYNSSPSWLRMPKLNTTINETSYIVSYSIP